MIGEISGRLADLVVMERQHPARGAGGDAAGAWAFAGQVRADVRPDGAMAAVSAGEAARSMRRWRVLLRDRDDLDLQMRLRWRGQVLAVLAVLRDPALPGLATLLCEGRSV